MTTIQELSVAMLTERTAHSILDSGAFYGRAYQQNRKVEWSTETVPQAELTSWGPTVSFYHHMQACLELDVVCEAFNALPCEDWDGDHYGTSQVMSDFLERIGAEVERGWNSYNWDNRFDQTVQGHRVTINDEQYTLLQLHGGCDVRGGYTDAKLFKIQEWMEDYWMDDSCSFCIPRAAAEAAGYPKVENPEYDYVVLDYEAGTYKPTIWDDCLQDQDGFDFDVDKLPDDLKVEGTQRAVEH